MNILNQENKSKINSNTNSYLSISVLGKSLKLDIKYRANSIIKMNKEDSNIVLYLPKKYKTMNKVNIVSMAIKKFYNEIAEVEIENSMEMIRLILGFAPEDYKIERINNSFCKSGKDKIIIVNPDIVKYSKKIIDTTLIQAFCKTKYSQNSKIYKETIKEGIEKYEKFQYKLMKSYNKDPKTTKVS